MIFRRRRRHLRELDARVRDARERAAEAQREARLSQRRLESVRENVVKPLRGYAEHNQFAELIRKSLIDGSG